MLGIDVVVAESIQGHEFDLPSLVVAGSLQEVCQKNPGAFPALQNVREIEIVTARVPSLSTVETLNVRSWKGTILPSLTSVDTVYRACKMLDCRLHFPVLTKIPTRVFREPGVFAERFRCPHITYGKTPTPLFVRYSRREIASIVGLTSAFIGCCSLFLAIFLGFILGPLYLLFLVPSILSCFVCCAAGHVTDD